MASLKEQREIDRIYNALRPRLQRGGGGSGGGSVTVPQHTHPATDISVAPAGDVASTNAQAAIEELDTEKLPIDGHRAMEGDLDLGHHNITNINDAEVEHDVTVGHNATLSGGVGAAVVSGVRKITMTGAEADGEARIEAVKALAFTAVTPTAEVQRMAWDSVEKTLVVFVPSGA